MYLSVRAAVVAGLLSSMAVGAPALTVASAAPGGVEAGSAYAYVESDRLVLVETDGRRELLAAPDDLGERSGLSFAPDGRRLAYIAEGNAVDDLPGVFVIDPFVEDRARRVVSGTAQLDWSPDGQHLAYQATDGALMTVDVATGATVQVAEGSEPDDPDGEGPGVDRFHGCPDWSPDGSMLAVHYQSFSEGGDGYEGSRDEVRVYRSDGGGLVGAVPSFTCPTWAPDGSRYAYVSTSGEVRAVRPDGSGDELLVPVACGSAWLPQWGPSGVLFNRSVRHSETSETATELLRPDCIEDRWNGTWLHGNDGALRRVLAHDDCCAILTPTGDRFTYPEEGPRTNDYGNHNRVIWIADLQGNTAKLTLDDEWASAHLSIAPTPAPHGEEAPVDSSTSAAGATGDDTGGFIDQRSTAPARIANGPATTSDAEMDQESSPISADEHASGRTARDRPSTHVDSGGAGDGNRRGKLLAAAVVAALGIGAALLIGGKPAGRVRRGVR